MNPRFETINGKLCMMLEKPDAINEFSKTPCVIVCKYEGLKKYYILDFPLSNPSMSMLSEVFEILGYPVEEGSKEWAVWQMIQGKQIVLGNGSVKHAHIRFIKDNAVFCSACGQLTLDINDWLLSAEKSGWQLYTEKPLLADAKVGDLVKNKFGWFQIDDTEYDKRFPIYAKKHNCFTLDGKASEVQDCGIDILEWQPLAEKGTTAWGLQRMLLGDTIYHQGIWKYSHRNGVITYTNIADNTDNRRVSIDEWLHEKRDMLQWQLYEPKPAKEQFEVGDWVTDGVVQGKIASFSNGTAWVVSQGSGYHINIENLRILKPEEVKVKISLKGTVRSGSNESCFDLSTPNGGWATIGYNEIDPATAALVRELVARQKGDNK